MKGRWQLVASFAAGLVVGGIAAAAIVGWHWNRNFSSWYLLEVADQANVTKQIHLGNAESLASRIDRALPDYVRAIRRELAGTEGSEAVLWAVKGAYEAAGETPPPDVQAVFKSLPPKESCKYPRRPR